MVSGCGGSGNTHNNSTSSDKYADVAGTWNVTENCEADTRGNPAYTYKFASIITVNGDQITILDTEGHLLTGTISGNIATWSADVESKGTILSMEIILTFSSDRTSLAGDISWARQYTNATCSSTGMFKGTKK
jgi:hypothetical protein